MTNQKDAITSDGTHHLPKRRAAPKFEYAANKVECIATKVEYAANKVEYVVPKFK